jgi:class 3 adenylate cyclase
MFTDIVGYTALMGKDSAKALELVRISKEIQKPLVEKHHGQWLKEMGDGALVKFGTALDAVNCAIDIQELARAKFDSKLRIGIHSGDITIEQNDIYESRAILELTGNAGKSRVSEVSSNGRYWPRYDGQNNKILVNGFQMFISK